MPSYPTSDPTDSTLYIAVNNFSTVLSAGIDNSVTTIPVISTTGAPANGFVTIGTELIHYTSIDATNFLGATRGYGTTTAAAHSLSDPVTHTSAAEHHNALKDEIKAVAEDLRDSFEADLDDSVAPAATATDHKERQDQIATQLKNVTGETDWKTVPTDTLKSIDTRLDTAESDISTAESDIDTAEADIVALEQNIVNFVDNAGMEIWQRGTSFSSPASGTYQADRWLLQFTGTPTFTIDRSAADVDSGEWAMKIDITVITASSQLTIREILENPKEYAGKTITLSARIQTGTANAIRLRIDDNIGSTYSSYHTGGGSYETLTVTRTLSSSITALELRIGMIDNGDQKVSTTYVDSVVMGFGDRTIPFRPITPAIDQMRCERHYQRIGGDVAENVVADGFCISVTQSYVNCRFIATMKSIPTITVVGGNSWRVYNSAYASIDTSSVVASAIHKRGCRLIATAPAASFTLGQGNHLRTSGTTEYLEAVA